MAFILKLFSALACLKYFILLCRGRSTEAADSGRVCAGTEGHLDGQAVQQFEGCEHVNGSLIINQSSLSSSHPVTYQQLLLLQDVREIDGYLLLEGLNHSDITDFRFLRHLQVIHGHHTYIMPWPFGQRHYSLVVQDNPHLLTLGLASLRRIENGGVTIQNNPELCLVDTIHFTDFLVSSSLNKVAGYSFECSEAGIHCHEQCVQSSGCWGTLPDECVTCRGYQYLDTCVETCNTSVSFAVQSSQQCEPLPSTTPPATITTPLATTPLTTTLQTQDTSTTTITDVAHTQHTSVTTHPPTTGSNPGDHTQPDTSDHDDATAPALTTVPHSQHFGTFTSSNQDSTLNDTNGHTHSITNDHTHTGTPDSTPATIREHATTTSAEQSAATPNLSVSPHQTTSPSMPVHTPTLHMSTMTSDTAGHTQASPQTTTPGSGATDDDSHTATSTAASTPPERRVERTQAQNASSVTAPPDVSTSANLLPQFVLPLSVSTFLLLLLLTAATLTPLTLHYWLRRRRRRERGGLVVCKCVQGNIAQTHLNSLDNCPHDPSFSIVIINEM